MFLSEDFHSSATMGQIFMTSECLSYIVYTLIERRYICLYCLCLVCDLTDRGLAETASHCSECAPEDVGGAPPDDATDDACRKRKALARRKLIVSEWQTIAMIIDQLLFWVFLTATVVAYLVIIVIAPYTKPSLSDDFTPIDNLTKPDCVSRC